MTASENIVLNVGNQGLSYAIDKKLDTELNTDVKLGINEWNSVFNIIKQNQVATNKSQFTDKDTDIRKGNQFVVQANENYAITKNVWSQIVDIAKQKMGITTPVEDEAPVSGEDVQDTPKAVDSKEAVKTILQNAGINFDEESAEFQRDVVSKYDLIMSVAEKSGQEVDETTLQTRIENYAKAWKFQQFNKQSVLGEVGEFQSDCSNAKTLDELKQSYKQFGAEYTEFYDNDGNKAVDAYEMFYQELQDHYSTKGLSSAEAKAKALEVIQEYSQKGYSIANLPDNVDTDEMELFTLVLSKIGVLDANKDGVLGQDEAASYLLTMAQMNDKKNNITSQEFLATEMAILDPESEEMISEKLTNAKKFLFEE